MTYEGDVREKWPTIPAEQPEHEEARRRVFDHPVHTRFKALLSEFDALAVLLSKAEQTAMQLKAERDEAIADCTTAEDNARVALDRAEAAEQERDAYVRGDGQFEVALRDTVRELERLTARLRELEGDAK